MNVLIDNVTLTWNGLTAVMGRILGSRKMIINVVALAVLIASFLSPELGDRIEKLGGYAALILFVVGSNGMLELGDFVKAWAAKPTTIQGALTGIKDEVLAPLVGSIPPTQSSAPPVPPPVLLTGEAADQAAA